jgi:amino-acid N-acetyltransferase
MIRKAAIDDVKTIHGLLATYGRRGELLSRPLSELYDHLRDFWVYQDPSVGKVVGCCALQFCWERLAEIRSLAVEPAHTGAGIGTRLARAAVAEARRYRVSRLFTLTYRPLFFQRLGFEKIDRADLPIKIWGGCLHCVKFPDCDEIAMMRSLGQE